MLVEYRRIGAESIYFRATLVDLPTDTDLEKYVTQRIPGGGLQMESPAEPVDVDGVAGTHFVLAVPGKGEKVLQDVYVFNRGRRTYFFTGAYPASDSQSRQQVHRAVLGITWKK
jgi:hypothetical protein